jgi:ATP-dependent helicase/nuclease subunit A
MTQQSFDFGPPEPTAASPAEADRHASPAEADRPVSSDAPWTPPDQPARDRIVAELDANLLVEAGAGSGKTTSMVGRMVELVRAGREVERIAAVTFTRKAAAELRERFQERLERAYRDAVAAGDGPAAQRFGAALDTIDRSFLGTIHSFCARLLRERPLEAGIAPDFEEVSGPDEHRLRAESWTRFLERLGAREGSRLMRALADHGLQPAQLHGAFREVAENPDVRFPAPAAPPLDPADVQAVRHELERLLDRSDRLMPAQEHARGVDKLQAKIRGLRYRRWIGRWDRQLDFMAALEDAIPGKNEVTQYTWIRDGVSRGDVRALRDAWDDFCREGGRARRLLEAWWALRYRVVMRFARAAASSYRSDRRRVGKLTFQDLLVGATALLRDHPGARAELGERYRWLLVDEFQDTDPVQAEMLLLLAADPAADPPPASASASAAASAASASASASGATPGGTELWQRVVPRPGALFVVGDPKQSIYRFRRADIAVYNRVKARFRDFGDVLHLDTNFRSRPPIEAVVNRVFRDRFLAEETEHQAAFAPLRVRPDRSSPGQGVYWYRFDADTSRGKYSGQRIADPECELLAAWIRERIERGERKPRDFMVLAMRKNHLATYARALEAHGIPVQVTGAGVGADLELTELVLLLRALADPDDPVLTLAVLEGLFFGLSHEELYAFARRGGRLSFLADSTGADAQGGGGTEGGASADPGAIAVVDALATLRGFWLTARRFPADVAVARIVDRLGILPWAAAGELGSTRAGAVVYALDALRAAARDGGASLPEAIEILGVALAEEVEAPLVPGETDAVRVMNLHKAKGLEAPVVVLAYPAALEEPVIRRHIARDGGGGAVGWLRLSDPTRGGDRVIARPADWDAHEAAERPFEESEDVRILYVAATRAAEELVVARCDQTADSSCWAALHEALDTPGLATELLLAGSPAPEREMLGVPPHEVARRVHDTALARQRLGEPSYRARPVTSRVHGDGPGAVTGMPDASDLPPVILHLSGLRPTPADALPPEARGREWGSAVHRALEAAGRGAQGEVLRAVCRAALVEFERPVAAISGDPVELDELVALVEAVLQDPIWDQVRGARQVLVEAPFSFSVSGEDAIGLGIAEPADVEILDGTIDLAFQDQDGRWTVVDFKTDARRDADRDRAYERQGRLYALALSRV